MKVLLLMGGRSPEREISLRTGRGIARALGGLGHEVKALDTGTGRVVLIEADAAPRAAGGPASAELLPDLAPATALEAVRGATEGADVVFIALHGGEGEDGTIQAILDVAGVPYTGSGVLASALAMNKEMSRRLFHESGIPIPRGIFVGGWNGTIPRAVREFAATVGWPLVVKPNDLGSTVGVTIADGTAAFEKAFDVAGAFTRDILVEEYIPGRELTVGVLGDEALPVVEMIPESGFYDYEAKYTKGQTRYEVPARLSEPQAMRVRELGRAAFHALGCEGFARVDFRLHPDGTPYCLEVNSIPGMTELSLLPMSARAAGIGYDELVNRIILLALEREKRKAPARR